MADLFRAVLPLPPGINQSYRIVAYGQARRLAASAELARFKQEAALVLASTGRPSEQTLARIRQERTPLAVDLALYVPILLRRDIDGPIKAALDAAFTYLGLNDNLVIELHCKKLVGEPRCEIAVFCVEDEACSGSRPKTLRKRS